MKQKNKNKKKHSLEKEMGTDKPKATTITMENNQKQITDEENDFVICFENGVVGIVNEDGGIRRKKVGWSFGGLERIIEELRNKQPR